MDDEPIPAATLIVVRETAAGEPQLLMVERAEGMAFAAGAMVFPGGRIDDADRALAAQRCLDEAALAAIRETLEETGVPIGLSPLPNARTALELQRELALGGGFADLLVEYGLEVDAGTLTPFARWVPRFHAVRRFDTLFFVTSCPPGDWRPRIIARRMRGRGMGYGGRDPGARAARASAPDLPDPANARAARLARQLRGNPRRCAGSPDRAGDSVGRGARW